MFCNLLYGGCKEDVSDQIIPTEHHSIHMCEAKWDHVFRNNSENLKLFVH